MSDKLKDYDPARYLNSKEDVKSFLRDAFETNDPKIIANAFSVASRAKLEGDAMGLQKKRGYSLTLAELKEIAFKDQECKRAYDELSEEFEALRKEVNDNKKLTKK